MAMVPFGEGNDDAMRQMFGPMQVDQQLRQAIQTCWMSLPAERRSAGEVEAQIRRLMDRALASMREDAGAFGFTDDPAG